MLPPYSEWSASCHQQFQQTLLYFGFIAHTFILCITFL